MDVKKLQLIKANLERDRLEMRELDDEVATMCSPTMLLRLNQELSNLVTMLLEEN